MKASKLVSVSLVSSFFAFGNSVALAQPDPATTSDAPTSAAGFDHPVPAVQRAIELAVTPGYVQSAGKLGGNLGNIDDLTGPGGALEIDLGYRLIPQLTVGAYGTFQKYQRGDSLFTGTNVLGATAGVQAIFHARPDRSIDPWVSLGTGWKGLWIDPSDQKTTSLQGLELARIQIGADYRVSDTAAISPVLGGSAAMFISQDSPMTSDFSSIHDKKVNWTWFAGMSGRFDLGARH